MCGCFGRSARSADTDAKEPVAKKESEPEEVEKEEVAGEKHATVTA